MRRSTLYPVVFIIVVAAGIGWDAWLRPKFPLISNVQDRAVVEGHLVWREGNIGKIQTLGGKEELFVRFPESGSGNHPLCACGQHLRLHGGRVDLLPGNDVFEIRSYALVPRYVRNDRSPEGGTS